MRVARFLLPLGCVMANGKRDPAKQRTHRVRRLHWLALIAAGATIALLSLPSCAARDPRTPAERQRDSAIWSRAHALTVYVASGPTRDCKSLGVVSEHYYDDVPPDNGARPRHMSWPEYVLRFRAAELGANAAVIKVAVARWQLDRLDQSRDLGEAFLCRDPTLTAGAVSSPGTQTAR